MSVKSILSCVTPNNESMDEEIQTYSDDNPESSSIVKEAWKNQSGRSNYSRFQGGMSAP